MADFFNKLLQNITVPAPYLGMLISSAVLILVVIILRAMLWRFIRRSVQSSEMRRRWLTQIRNGLLLLMILGLVMIWAHELRTLALSIVAIAVAFVVATKELILCLTGSLIKSGARSFTIGDRIQIKDFRGDVIDQNLLATTILEVGPGKLTHQRTGRMIVVPNALFVSEPVVNESYTHDYVLHVFTVPFKRDENWQLAQVALLEAAQKHCSPYLEQARKYMRRMSDHSGFEIPSVDPRVTLQVPTAGEVHLIVRFPAKQTQRSFIEQQILNDVFTQNDLSVPKKCDEAVEKS